MHSAAKLIETVIGIRNCWYSSNVVAKKNIQITCCPRSILAPFFALSQAPTSGNANHRN